MRFYALVAIAEAAIIVGSGIDARWRPASDRSPWVARWFWWHIAPLWLLWLAFVTVLMRSAEAVAGRSAETHAARRHDAPSILANDEAPPSAYFSDST